MISRMEVVKSPLSRSTEFRIVLSDEEYAAVNFDVFDRQLIEDCNKADSSVADKLLALECIFRRMREQIGRGESECERDARRLQVIATEAAKPDEENEEFSHFLHNEFQRQLKSGVIPIVAVRAAIDAAIDAMKEGK